MVAGLEKLRYRVAVLRRRLAQVVSQRQGLYAQLEQQTQLAVGQLATIAQNEGPEILGLLTGRYLDPLTGERKASVASESLHWTDRLFLLSTLLENVTGPLPEYIECCRQERSLRDELELLRRQIGVARWRDDDTTLHHRLDQGRRNRRES